MYYPNTESTVMPGSLVYEMLPNGMALVMIRKNIRSVNEHDAETGHTYTKYMYDEVQFETDADRSVVEASLDDLYRRYSGSVPTMEERIAALEKAIAEIGGLL